MYFTAAILVCVTDLPKKKDDYRDVLILIINDACDLFKFRMTFLTRHRNKYQSMIFTYYEL